jgi:hypothetical protein
MENPYEAPHAEPAPVVRSSAGSAALDVIQRSLLWIVICGVSAIPSFLWGMNVSRPPFSAIAMILGTLIFAAGYTVLDLVSLREICRRNEALRRAIFFGFGTRLVCSAIFPIGAVLDMFPGIISVGLVERLVGSLQNDHTSWMITSVFLTTLIQGLLLNIELWCLIVLIYGLVLAWPNRRRRLNDARAEQVMSDE